MKVAARIDGVQHWWNGKAWDTEESEAEQLSQVDAQRRLRINNTNNRFLDSEDQVEAFIVSE